MNILIDYDENVLFYVRRINDLMVNFLNSKIKEKDLTWSQAEIISFLHCNEMKNKPVTQKDIETYFGLSHPTVIGILKRLQNKGFVTVTVNKNDKRHRDVMLTDKSIDLKSDIESSLGIKENFLSELMTEEQQKVITELLKTIYIRIKTITEQ